MELAHKNVESVPSAGDCSAGSRVDHLRRTLWNVKGSIRSGYDVVRIISALVLLTAAGLKAYQLSTEPVLGTSILDSRWLLMLTVEFELFFGLWLLSGLLPRLTWATAIGLFGLFACVSVYKALSGAASCGCFGRVEVNPWYTAFLDLTLVLSLMYWRPRHLPSLAYWKNGRAKDHLKLLLPVCMGRASDNRLPLSVFQFPQEIVHRTTIVILSWLIIGLPIAFAMGSYANIALSSTGEIIGDGKIVVLEPEKWIGKRFPLLGHIDIGGKLREGDWYVLLYHHDCPKCQQVIPKYEKLARSLAANRNTACVALIEMPPYSDTDLRNLLPRTQCVLGRLNNSKEWFVETPVVFRLHQGIFSSL